jgi:polyferredoxin/tetratricopeptide (TPR) repeat protein
MDRCAKDAATAPANVPLPVLAAPRRGAAFGSRRGRARALVLAGVWAFMLLHVVQWLAMGTTLAPIEPSESMATVKDGIVTVGAVFFALALLSTALLGRWFCGWGCHWVSIQDGTAWLLARWGIRPRPFRSRLLVWMPLALALYMFAWPLFYRFAVAPFVRPDLRWPGFSMHVTTQEFWATFPGLAMGIPFVLVSGVLVVWLLGTKGYCTYACPYGGLFAPADELAPMRIVVDHDRCHQCGRCTAACTSNVRVHEEIRDFGMVVDSGCMKCMDCVASCPNEALSFGLGKPAVAVDRAGSRSAAAAERRWDLSWAEEVALAAIGVGALLAVRGIYLGVPLLFASGIAACCTFLAWKSWRVVRDRDVSFHGARLRFRGRIGASGWAWLACSALALGGVAYAGALNAVTWLADRSDAQVTLPAEAIFGESAQEPDPAMRSAAERALALYALASPPPDGWSVLPFGWRQVDLRRAYLLCALRRLDEAERIVRRSWERDGADEGAAAVVGRILRTAPARREEAFAWYDRALEAHPGWQRLREEQVTWLDHEGEHARVVRSARDGLAAVPGDLLAMRRLSLALVERGATDAEVEEGIALVRRTLEMAPGNGFAHAALARGLARLGRWDEAAAEFRRAQELEPGSEMIRSMAEEAEARRSAAEPPAPMR